MNQGDSLPPDRRLTFGRRFHRKKDYDEVFQQGAKSVRSLLVLYFHPTEAGDSALGTAVSRKVGNAVVRNRVKRVLREMFRQLRPEFERHGRLVVVARHEAGKGTRAALRADFMKALQRQGILKS